MDYFGSTNKGPPVYVASGNAARASRPRRGKRRKPTRKGRKRAPPKRTISEIYRRKHNKTHLRDIIREERAQYRPQTNDEFTNENLNADVVSNIESLNLNNESISGEKGKIGGRRRTRRRRKRGVPTSLSQKGGGDVDPRCIYIPASRSWPPAASSSTARGRQSPRSKPRWTRRTAR